jgi:type VI secretion system protein ImpE
MASTKELVNSGDLTAAIAETTRQVKARPTDAAQRIALFELLCFAGEWDRAEKQLAALGGGDAQAEISLQVYRNNIKAERDRRRLHDDGLAPHFLVEPPAYVDLHLEALNRVREGNFAEARVALDRAEDERPALAGRMGDRAFSDIRDYDDFTAPVLELVVHDKYVWLPFEQVVRIEMDAPRRLRDMLWAPARIEAADGTTGEVFVMVLYAGSSDHANDQVRLGRMTEWEPIGEGLYRPAGMRTLLVDDEERAILGVRGVAFERTASSAAPTA